MILWIAAFLACLPLSIGLPTLLFGYLLEKSNVIGNSTSDTDMISSPVSMYYKEDNLPGISEAFKTYGSYNLTLLKGSPEYKEAVKNSLNVDHDFCAQGIALRGGQVVVTSQITSTIVDMKIEPVNEPSYKSTHASSSPADSSAPKRSWKDAIAKDPADLEKNSSNLEKNSAESGSSKSSCKDAVDDTFAEIDKIDPNDSSWHT